jgi:hypothetical protein
MGSKRRNTAASFGEVSHRLTRWTTTLLALAIVLAMGLALGWQLMSWFRERPEPRAIAAAAPPISDLPPVLQQREFSTNSGLLKVQRQSGTPTDALNAMREFCREKIPNRLPRETKQGETEFVAKLLNETPLEEADGLALYQPAGQAAMIVAIDRPTRQIVSWSLATPAGDGQWSLYHFRPK